ncbi:MULTISPECIES: hypothetical protein [unclassified Phenylobacterium]|jgi:hypothetical protein|uniref:hypothetical protein n=1 Tax=unclassified Phenylobacterium TaxID=2640670 RepID=UPI00083B9985|nr:MULTISPECIES: hypothetical protein [unclassified Phenylobacterium]
MSFVALTLGLGALAPALTAVTIEEPKRSDSVYADFRFTCGKVTTNIALQSRLPNGPLTVIALARDGAPLPSAEIARVNAALDGLATLEAPTVACNRGRQILTLTSGKLNTPDHSTTIMVFIDPTGIVEIKRQ